MTTLVIKAMEKVLNEKESLELITRMIDNTRKGMEKNAARPMLIFGYVSVLTALAVWFAIRQTGDYMYNLLWLSIPVLGWIIYWIMERGKTRTQGASRSHMGKIITRIWILLAVAMFLCAAAAFLVHPFPATFVITLLVSVGVSTTGLMVLYKPFIVCGLIGILLSFAFLWVDGINTIPLIAIAFVIIMVVPAHILQCAANKKLRSDV
ncbi:MAG: hypothetical protein KBG08_06210 [Bacteroidales bacterium]|nr:hypothetical protein [Bacteroidales bacterium]HQB58173.1 hypothetical protein [Bacteroidales bacterium]HQF06368.1 hypothetical protein [Bacteroidales bacterium]